MKKMIAAAVVCAMVFSLAGCGSRETERGRDDIDADENVGQGGDTQTPPVQNAGGPEKDMSTQPGSEADTSTKPGSGEDTSTQPGSEEDTSGQTESESGMTGQTGTESAVAEPGADGSSALVVYFSWSGNTENVANAIAAQTGADIFEIVPEEAYTSDYNALLDIASEEKESGARPAIAESIEDIAQYDIVYVGYPNWWSDMPMILYTFFDSYDLSGKTIALFCTSGGSGLSDTVNSIKGLEPEADVLEGLHIGSSSASDPENAVSEWLGTLGVVER